MSTAAAAIFGLVLTADVEGERVTYASWTPVPETVHPQGRAKAGDACIAESGRPDAEVALAERRGEWIGVVATSHEPAVTTCLVHLPSDSEEVGDVSSATSGGEGAVPAHGQFTDGAISEFLNPNDQSYVSFNIGDVGAGVVGVTITTADGHIVDATVEGGRFLAWWPGRAFGSSTEGNGGPAPSLSYRITLDNGTVVDNATPVRP
ncbi:hypothetical protein WEH80_26855 [Actinomycetes bacterium KLBMP 9759]